MSRGRTAKLNHLATTTDYLGQQTTKPYLKRVSTVYQNLDGLILSHAVDNWDALINWSTPQAESIPFPPLTAAHDGYAVLDQNFPMRAIGEEYHIGTPGIFNQDNRGILRGGHPDALMAHGMNHPVYGGVPAGYVATIAADPPVSSQSQPVANAQAHEGAATGPGLQPSSRSVFTFAKLLTFLRLSILILVPPVRLTQGRRNALSAIRPLKDRMS